MEKKFILVGMHNRRLAFDFMNSVIRSLDSESVAITYVDNYRHQLKTDHTEVWFVSPDYWLDRLLGVRADAIFGIPYDFLMARARPNALIAERERVGLVDYICEVERSAKNHITDIEKWAVYALLVMHIHEHNIPAMTDMNRRDNKLIIQHLYRAGTAVHILWDEVEDIKKAIETVKKELDRWISDKKVWITTSNPYCDDMRGGYTYAKPEFAVKHICDEDITQMYPKMLFMTGRCNGKSQAFAEYADKVICAKLNKEARENMTMNAMVDTLSSMGFNVEKRYDCMCKGYRFTISKDVHYTSAFFEYPADTSREYCDARQREFIDYIVNKWHKDHMSDTKTDIPTSLKRIALNAVYGKCPTENYTKQLEIYAALMKGENNMPIRTNPNPECVEYCRKDVAVTTTMVKTMRELMDKQTRKRMFGIKKVYFNDPVTVVIWEDGTKTVVRCTNDQYDPEKGLAMAIAKKALGTNKSGSNYYDAFKKWLPKTEEETEETKAEVEEV